MPILHIRPKHRNLLAMRRRSPLATSTLPPSSTFRSSVFSRIDGNGPHPTAPQTHTSSDRYRRLLRLNRLQHKRRLRRRRQRRTKVQRRPRVRRLMHKQHPLRVRPLHRKHTRIVRRETTSAPSIRIHRAPALAIRHIQPLKHHRRPPIRRHIHLLRRDRLPVHHQRNHPRRRWRPVPRDHRHHPRPFFVSTNCPGASTLSTVQFGTAAAFPPNAAPASHSPASPCRRNSPACSTLHIAEQVQLHRRMHRLRHRPHPAPQLAEVAVPDRPAGSPPPPPAASPASSTGCVSNLHLPTQRDHLRLLPARLRRQHLQRPALRIQQTASPARIHAERIVHRHQQQLVARASTACRRNGRANASASSSTSAVRSANSSR